MEIIGPKPEFVELVKLIVAQNDLIIHMNQSLIEILANPQISYAPEIKIRTGMSDD